MCDLMTVFPLMNCDEGIWSDPMDWTRFYEFRDFSCFYSIDHFEMYNKCVRDIQLLDMTPEEQATYLSYVVASVGR